MSKARWVVLGYAAGAAFAAALFGILRAAGVAPGRAALVAIFETLAVMSLSIAGMWLWAARKRSRRERAVAALIAFPRLLQAAGFAFVVLLGIRGFVALFGGGVVLNLIGRRVALRLLD